MRREIGWDAITHDDRSVVTVGTFDGVHRGHQAIIEYLIDRAATRDGVSTLLSFDPHPRSVVHDEDVPLLSTIDERGDLLARYGLDRFVVVPFDEDFGTLSPTAYVEDVLVSRIGLQEITVGYDHRFGRKRAGDVELLRTLGARHGFAVDVIPAQIVDDTVVSSSKIRACLLDEGDVAQAATWLGRPYALTGTVRHGEGRGRTIGYPTANIAVADARKLVPKRGVYATYVRLPGGTKQPGMMNIGRRPTFDGMDVTIEVHLLDFSGDLYGQTLTVEFLQRLRDEQKFDSVDALVAQLSTDESHCRSVIETLK
ncbi:bifunctional riboflavin kinase/FAD synthetase [Salisaeta longa]|uniref:bifunctional riboflavin kinase/FAD synthetase n=1 Tax=Salisaeta longa TaxID=503170 RepID=UPI0003B57E26|nr:bifunctional riboflavin kinase/FAD synthetase [Salisaeta longa]